MELLKEYLSNTCTPERKIVLLDACDVLETVGIVDHYDYIDQLLAMAQDGRTDTTLGGIEDILYTKYTEAVNSYGIVLVDNAPLKIMSHLIWGLGVVEYWADPQLIVETLDASATGIDGLSEVLGLLTEENGEEWFTYIVSVAPALIDRIREELAIKLVVDSLDDAEAEACAARIARFNRYFTNVKPVNVATALIVPDWRVNFSINSIPAKYLENIKSLSDQAAAEEIIGFASLSKCTDEELNATIGTLLDNIYNEINIQQRILTVIERIIKAAQNGQA